VTVETTPYRGIPMEIAFEAKLVPKSTADTPRIEEAARPIATVGFQTPESANPESVSAVLASSGNAVDRHDDASPAAAERIRKPEPGTQSAAEITPGAELRIPADSATASQVATPPAFSRNVSTEPVSQPERVAPPPPPEPVRPPAPAARDIQLHLDGPDGRVDVRLVERAGEVRVEVRAPDPRLAGELRSDLPGLAQKLEQTGYRADAWHPGAGGAAERPNAEPSTRTTPQHSGDSPRQDAREQQQQSRDDRPKPGNESNGRKPQRKDFAWLLSALR
jgi:hypothetical protein